MLQPILTRTIEDVLEELKKKDPLGLLQVLIPLLKDASFNELTQSQQHLAVFEEYKCPLYSIVRQLESIKGFIASKRLDGATTSEINDFFSGEFKAGLIKERLEMLIFNKNIKMGKKRIGVYVSNVYYTI